MKHFLRGLVVLLAMAAFVSESQAAKGGGKAALDAPSLSCGAGTSGTSIDIVVTAGASGAPAGVTIHWILQSELDAHGGNWGEAENEPSYCQGSFSGNAKGNAYRLDPGESVTIKLGEGLFTTPGASSACENTALDCGQAYAFRTFAHGNSTSGRSAWSSTKTCSTQSCDGGGGGDTDDGEQFGCTVMRDVWLDLGPSGNFYLWPINGMTLGNVFYTDFQAESILAAPAGTNGLVALAQELIAAKLNIANGASPSSVAFSLTSADTLIGSLVIPPVGTGTLPLSATSTLTTRFNLYNNGIVGPGPCE